MYKINFETAMPEEVITHMMHYFVEHDDFCKITPEAHKAVLDLIVSLTCAVDNSERGWKPVTDDFAVPMPHPLGFEDDPETYSASGKSKRYTKLQNDFQYAEDRVRDAHATLNAANRFRTRAKKALVKFFGEHHRAFRFDPTNYAK